MTLCAAISRAMDEGESTCGARYTLLIMCGWFYCFSVLLALHGPILFTSNILSLWTQFCLSKGLFPQIWRQSILQIKKKDLSLETETERSFSRLHVAKKNTLDSFPRFLPLHISLLIHSSCICTLSFNLYCWEIAYSSPCGCESLIISLNASGNGSIMSHIMFYSQYLVGVAFEFRRGFVRKT